MGEQKHKNPQTFYRNVKHIMIFKDKDHLLLFCFIYFRKIEIQPSIINGVKNKMTPTILILQTNHLYIYFLFEWPVLILEYSHQE